MTQKRNDDPEPEQLPADEKRLEHPIAAAKPRPKATPTTEETGETTRVYLTGDNRDQVTEHYVPTAELGFRINVDGVWFEQVGIHADSGATVFAPTR